MNESSSPSHDFLTLADIVGVYGIKGWVRLRVRLDDPNLLLSLSDLTLIAAPEAPRSARQSVVVEALQVHGKGHCQAEWRCRSYSSRSGQRPRNSGGRRSIPGCG